MNQSKDIFFSYNWEIKSEVLQLEEKLSHFTDLKIWRDERELKNDQIPLSSKLAAAIKESKLFICFITINYCKSHNCNLEIEYANTLAKPIIVLMIDRLRIEDIVDIAVKGRSYGTGIGFIINPLFRINCYENRNNWVDSKFDAIKNAIEENMKKQLKDKIIVKNIFNGRYESVEKIGEGIQAIVYKVVDLKDSNKSKAMKQFKALSTSFDIKYVVKEIEILKSLNNKYIIKYLDSFQEASKNSTTYYAVTNYYENGTLYEKIAKNRATNNPLDSKDIIRWSYQLLTGIQYLHDNKLIHRDIKPTNIFLHNDNVVLGDLGHAKSLSIDQSISYRTIGTSSYLAPEVSKYGFIYSDKADIWSFGCVLYEMVKLEKLFNGLTIYETVNSINRFENKNLSTKNIPAEFLNILEKSLQPEPSKRSTAKELIQIFKDSFLLSNEDIEVEQLSEEVKELREQLKDCKRCKNKLYNQDAFLIDANYDIFNKKGINLSNLDRHEEAIKYYDKAINLNPNNPNVFKNKGNSLANLNRYQESVECYNKVIELDPTNAKAYYNKGVILSNLERYGESIHLYNKAIELNPNYYEAFNNKGLCLYYLKQYLRAVRCFDKVIELNPNDAEAFNNKGVSLNNLNRFEEAIKCYDKAIQLDPFNFEALYNKANSLVSLNKHSEAIKSYDKVINLNQNYSKAFYGKGLCFYYLNKNYEAKRLYEKAIELNPHERFLKYDELEEIGKNRQSLILYEKKNEIELSDSCKMRAFIKLVRNTSNFIYKSKNYSGH